MENGALRLRPRASISSGLRCGTASVRNTHNGGVLTNIVLNTLTSSFRVVSSPGGRLSTVTPYHLVSSIKVQARSRSPLTAASGWKAVEIVHTFQHDFFPSQIFPIPYFGGTPVPGPKLPANVQQDTTPTDKLNVFA